jgi:serine/threonine protein kinase/formylglycine-generating enzyme required for sulfatase activity
MNIHDHILRLIDLRDAGVLSDEEFEAKVKLVMVRATSTTPPSAPVEAASGMGIGAYELVEKVGEGGMGAVYRGRHRMAAMAARQGGDVAIKLVHPHLVSRQEMIERLRREAEALASLEHPHIVRVHDLVEEGGRTAIVMEWVPGRPLSQVIGTETGPIPWERAWRWVRPMLEAVAHAHSRGVIHRDLKPENMVVTPEGVIKLLDFGIARLAEVRGRTKTGTSMGTVDYMAPEQYTDAGSVGVQADVYALGMTIYEMVAGRLPWEPDATEFAVLQRKHQGEIPPPTAYYPSIPPWVVESVMASLVPDPSRRTESVDALAAGLRGEDARSGDRHASLEPSQLTRSEASAGVDASGSPDVMASPPPRDAVGAPQRDAADGWEEVVEWVPTGEVRWVPGEVTSGRGRWGMRGPRETRLVQQPVMREVRRRFRKGWVSPSLGTFRFIPAGTFTMGSPPTEAGRYEDEVQHQVILSRAFYMMECPVTQAQWRAVMGNDPSHFKDREGRCPVEKVSWEAVARFVAAVRDRDQFAYRLPTEAEWEYAARGGEGFIYAGSDDVGAVAWYAGNAGARTHPVGSKMRNGYGLCDMSGNVWEWVADWFGPYPTRTVTDPTGPASGTHRVYRGGGWYNGPQNVRVADRLRATPNQRHDNVGFRLVVSVP